jgi:gamma-glutamylcyclotransferase (GGCT)/AIG2-like uncharacterized protein YtfP
VLRNLQPDLLAAYGTLRRRSQFQRGSRVGSKVRFLGTGRLRGRLFWQEGYPAAVPGFGAVPVEIFLVVDATVWSDLDRYEGCDLAHEASSLFYRRQVRLLSPSVIVWAYFLGHRQLRGNPVIS